MLQITDFREAQSVADGQALIHLLKKRYGNDEVNKFDLNEVGKAYPWLSIHVRSNLAVLHYFESEGGDFCISSSGGNAVANEDTEFFESEGAEAVSLPQSAIVSSDEAIKAALEFLGGCKRPECIEWLDL